MNTTLSGSGRVDDTQGHPEGEIRGVTKLVKITEAVRMYAAERMQKQSYREWSKKRKEFLEKAAEVYAKS
jgi:hypothetical protein